MFIFWFKRCDYCNVLIGHVARVGMELLSVGILKMEDCLGKQLIVVPFSHWSMILMNYGKILKF